MKRAALIPFLALLALGVHASEQERDVDAADDKVEAELKEELEQSQGQSVETLQDAVDALELRNDLLDVLLTKEELTEGDIAIVQQLTETIENALAKIDEALDAMSDQVQEVKAGAESTDVERIRENGKAYLEKYRTLRE
ncbi:hypothetical protein F0A17_18190 [Billgrantia pellis]|uniref:Uncharacterized protein n=1 Tax=Billgrantia pellis TaxID=2606936 RepID=A0A7V7FY91_9GAMM|nr:DUF6746 family protein [Halomonas pellis]KAA0010391.1 hypothetical protein F0A17_18190 [Halomonas pellis]